MKLLAVLALSSFAAGPPVPASPAQEEAGKRITALFQQADADWRASARDRAIARNLEAVALAEKAFGEWDPFTAVAIGFLPQYLSSQGRWKEALAQVRRQEAIATRVYGADDWNTRIIRQRREELETEARLTPAQRLTLARISRDIPRIAAVEGGVKEALTLGKRTLADCVVLLGPRHYLTATCHEVIGIVQHEGGDSRAALDSFGRAEAILRETVGDSHQNYGRVLGLMGMAQVKFDLKAAAATLRRALAISRGLGTEREEAALALNELGTVLQRLGDLAGAEKATREALAIRRRLHPPGHVAIAICLGNLGAVLDADGRQTQALALYREASAALEKGRGEKDANFIGSLINLGRLLSQTGGRREGVAVLRRAVALGRAYLRRGHTTTLRALDALAEAYSRAGDLAAAAELGAEAVRASRAALGERHPESLRAAALWGLMLLEAEDFRAAAPVLRRVAELARPQPGETHKDYIATLGNLGVALGEMRDRKGAVAAFEASIAAQRKAGEEPIDTLRNLAAILTLDGRTREALALLEPALRKPLRPRQREELLMALVAASCDAGDPARALRLSGEAESLRAAREGGDGPGQARSLMNMAVCLANMGRQDAALLVAERALAAQARRDARLAGARSERQQREAISGNRYLLNIRLSLPGHRAELSHRHVLAWKGAAFAHQTRLRAIAEAGRGDPAARADLAALDTLNRDIAGLGARNGPGDGERIQQRTADKERLERSLAGRGVSLDDPSARLTSDALADALPPGVALVDFCVYVRQPFRPAREDEPLPHHYAAWVLRRGRPPVRVELGPAPPINRHIREWRAALSKGRHSQRDSAVLRRMVWLPLERHLDGAGVVLLSPDGPLCRLPWAALPGGKADTFLIEEVSLGFVAVPRLLPGLLAPHKPAGPSLLAVGGVDFGEGAGAWPPLAGAAAEADLAVELFGKRGKAVRLSGGKATADAARLALTEATHAHLATHGYFAPDSMRSAADRGAGLLFGEGGVGGWHPGLLSGLVFADANRRVRGNEAVLTAQEVAGLPLSRLDMAVLSACETGLGVTAAGEGLLGLQRAFAVAGCRSVVGSLWSVDDAATSVLMERFYRHLWEKKLPKIEALRQAQIDVMRNPGWVERRRADLKKELVRRGTVGELRVMPAAGARRSPVAWWAAWQLSGDWR